MVAYPHCESDAMIVRPLRLTLLTGYGNISHACRKHLYVLFFVIDNKLADVNVTQTCKLSTPYIEFPPCLSLCVLVELSA